MLLPLHIGRALSVACWHDAGMAFRTIAYNVLQCTGFPAGAPAGMTSAAAYAEALGAYAPDVVTLAECPSEEVVGEIAERLGMRYAWFPSVGTARWGPWPGALLTRFAIEESVSCPHPAGARPEGEFTRHWGRVVLWTGDSVGAGERLVVHSIHLHSSDEAVREREVLAVLAAVRADVAEGEGPVVVQGDFNHRPEMREYEWWWNAGLFDTFEPEQGPGYTFRSDLPMARLDYVWVSRALQPRVVRGRALSEPPFVPGEGMPWALSDHVPQLAVVEGLAR